jgi:hypothetical protein
MARRKTTTKAVTKKSKENPDNLPSTEVMDFEGDSGKGFEGADAQSFAIPYLTVLQSNSPQCDEDDGKYIDGAKPGMFLNTVTNELFDGKDGVLLCPAMYRRMLVEWVPRDAGGGFRGAHEPSEVDMATLERDESGRFRMENGNFLADTRYHFVLMVKEDGSLEMLVISLTSTQIKKSKAWMTMMNTLKLKGKNGLFTPPMASHLYRATSVGESNDKGNWKGWSFEKERILTDEEAPIYANAMTFRQMVMDGQAVVTAPPEVDDTDGEDGDTPF